MHEWLNARGCWVASSSARAPARRRPPAPGDVPRSAATRDDGSGGVLALAVVVRRGCQCHMARHAASCALLLSLSATAGADEAIPPHPAMPTVDVKPISKSWPSGRGGLGPSGKNVLFIASDDMRPEISPYGHKYMHTPNMQSLADDGYTFRRM